MRLPRVDRIDELDDGRYELIDYKTGAPKSAEALEDDLQLAIYRLAAREAWQLDAESGAYWYVLDDEKVAVAGSADDLERVERTVLSAGEGILGQDFEPRPSPEICGWCDYRLICPASEGLTCTSVQIWYTCTTMTPWLLLTAAISSEVGATVALRYADGYTVPGPTLLSLGGYALSIWLLALTVKGLEISLVYAVWAGVGTAAIAVIGMTALGEPVTALKIMSIAVIITGVVGLNLAGSG